MIRVYSEHILLPLGQFGLLEEIVNSCQGLSKEESAALLELPQVSQKEKRQVTSTSSNP